MNQRVLSGLWIALGSGLLASACGTDELTTEAGEARGAGAATTGGVAPDAGGAAGATAGTTGDAGGATAHPVGKQFEAECAHGPDNGSCFGAVVGAQVGTSLANQGNRVSSFDTGDLLSYSGLDFTGSNLLRVRYASTNGGDVELRLDDPTGPLLATWQPLPTGGASSYGEATIQLAPAEGVHTLHVIALSGISIAELDWFRVEACTPDCSGKDCGDDGCGVPCGECTGTDTCSPEGRCEPCLPDCAGKECGDDGCEGSCGEPCATGEVCTAERTCVAYADLGGPPRLHVEGNAFVDPASVPVVLRGVSLINLAAQHYWRNGVPAMIDQLTSEGWDTRILRFPVYVTDPPNPFSLTDRAAREEYMRDILRPAVDHATRKGLYVIIDFHEISNVTAEKDAMAQAFWAYMAGQFAGYENVIYELFNEPIDKASTCVSGANDDCWPPFKAKAEGWAAIVRESAPSTLLLVGGPFWSQVIGPAADDPVSDPNVGYVGHIYPTHTNRGSDDVERQIRRCAAVHPVILTEWGFGFEGQDDREPYATIVKTMADELHLSLTAWVADPDWGPPMLTADGGLTEFGAFAQAWLAESE